jgi:hypothetical protein
VEEFDEIAENQDSTSGGMKEKRFVNGSTARREGFPKGPQAIF